VERSVNNTFAFSRDLFLRLLGLVYLIAFLSLAVQITGLVGSRGILPIGQVLTLARSQYGAQAYRILPTLLWLGSSDGVLTFLCWAGAALALVAVAGRARAPIFVLLWALYLSLTVAGQVFLEFQWDALLLETGVLACLYAPLRASRAIEPNPIVRWVLWSLAYKLTFLSGITKILSGDPSWAAWTAMTYHYETQPLPAWISWYAHQLPARLHYWSVPAAFAIELAAPFAIFLPVRFWWTRLVACAAMTLFQLSIAATGNYGFFNLLAIVLYLALLDDQTLRLRPSGPVADKNMPREPVAWRVATSTMAIGIAVVSTITFVQEMERTAGTPVQLEGAWADQVVRWLGPFRSINGYGLFRVMTTARPEIVIEVSADGQEWKEYEFRWKPGDPRRRPRFVEPHMPRLDWQMWFAALDPGGAQYWLAPLLQRILAGEPSVLRLLGPSPLTAPPRFARLAYYRYRFTTRAERAGTGAWWVRTFEGYLTDPIEAR
jgi:lipase maturation factor 1